MITALIVELLSVFVVVFVAIMTYIGITYKFNKPKKQKILNKQLICVITPIHKILFLSNEILNENKIEMIDEIIRKYYVLIHPSVYELFYENQSDLQSFSKFIDDWYKHVRNKLGYEKIKIPKINKQVVKLVAVPISYKSILIVAFIVVVIITLFQTFITRLETPLSRPANIIGSSSSDLDLKNELIEIHNNLNTRVTYDAMRGDVGAQFILGQMHFNGFGVPVNYYAAELWFRMSAEQNLSSAQYKLGVMYENGFGVIQNYTRALYWYELAALRGNILAHIALDRLENKNE